MTFYHFTHPLHLPKILSDGFLKTVESNIDYRESHVGPAVVWLLDEAEPDWGDLDGQHGLYPDKRLIRFEVDVPAIKWTDWFYTDQMDPKWKAGFVKSGGGEEAAEHWYVFPARIPAKRWVSVTDLSTGEKVA